MTTDERTALAKVLWGSVRALVSPSRQAALEELKCALESTYADHAEACMGVAYQEGRDAAEEKIELAQREAFQDGMLAVRKRSDYRDLDDIQDPEELRSTH